MRSIFRLLSIILLITSFCYGATVEFEGDSTAIARVVFVTDSADGTFYVFFTSNPTKAYTFSGMTMALFKEWRDAPSRGKFYNEVIKGNYNK